VEDNSRLHWKGLNGRSPIGAAGSLWESFNELLLKLERVLGSISERLLPRPRVQRPV